MHQRGSKKLYRNLIEQDGQKHSKGRSATLNAQKNKCIVDSYIFYIVTTNDRFDAVTNQLSIDFFLSPVTIGNIVNQEYEYLIDTKKRYSGLTKQAVKDVFAKKWPQYTWLLNK